MCSKTEKKGNTNDVLSIYKYCDDKKVKIAVMFMVTWQITQIVKLYVRRLQNVTQWEGGNKKG